MQFQFHHEQLSTTTLAATATAVFISAAVASGFPLGVQTPNGIVIDGLYPSGLGTASVITLTASGAVIARLSVPANGGSAFAPVHIRVNQAEDLQINASSTSAVTAIFHRALI